MLKSDPIKINSILRGTGCSVVLCAVLSATVHGDQSAQGLLLGPIKVTASKSDRDPFSSPESISVIDREQIESQQAAQLGELLDDLPNVSIAGGPRGIAQQVVIRGVGDERVVFLIDGARQNYARAHNGRVFVDPQLLKQVDVLRGPASALWGSGAVGGVVSLTTKDAADLLDANERAGGMLRLGYQSATDQTIVGGSAYGLFGDSLDVLFDVSGRDADDVELGDDTTLQHSAFDAKSYLGKMTWKPADGHALGLTLQGYEEEGEVPSNPQAASTPDELVDSDVSQHNAALRYTFDADGEAGLWHPSLLLYRNETDIAERRLIDDRRDDTEVVTHGLDMRNRMAFDVAATEHVFIAGIDYFKDEAEASRDGAPRDSFPSAEQSVLGIYVQDEITLADRWTLTPALRWDRYQSDADTGDSESQDETELSKKLTLSYDVTDWMSLHASYAEAFRAPAMTELFVSGTHFSCGPGCANLFVPNTDLKPEKAHNKEVGIRLHRSGLFTDGDRASAKLNVFRNDVDDFIDQIVNFTFVPVPGNPGAGGVSYFENVTDARLEGFEVELAYQAANWTVNAGYGQTRGDNRTTGEPLSNIPADELLLGASYQWPAHALSVHWKSRFVSDQQRVPDGVEPSDSYELHGIGMTWRPQWYGKDRVRLDVGIDNLFDEDYRPHLSVLKGPGRNVKASIAMRF